MGSSSKRRARKKIAKENTFWRVVPMEVIEDETHDGVGPHLKEAVLQDHPKAELIDTPFDHCYVVTVPPTCSYEMARSIEQRMMDSLGKPVIVMTNNLRLCRVEGPLDPKEIEEAFKGVENVSPEKLASALVNRAASVNAAAAREVEEEEEAADRPDPFAGALPDVDGVYADPTDEDLDPTNPELRIISSKNPDEVSTGESSSGRIDSSAERDPAQPELD